MIPIFTKPLELVTAADVEELKSKAWPEGYEVEFKKTLPHKLGGDDPWIQGKSEIGGYARDQMLAEVIALANATGGAVVLGVEESKKKPARAKSIEPLPRVGELAERFADMARTCIDPPLPRLQIREIETAADGGGVVIFRTGASRAAPHRLTTNCKSYVRRGSSTVEMTMREIQDMTLNVARGLAGIDAEFHKRRAAFTDWGEHRSNFAAFRMTAIPLAGVPDPGRIFRRPELFPYYDNFPAKVGSRTIDLEMRQQGWDERSLIRGIARQKDTSLGGFRYELYQGGLVDFRLGAYPRQYPAASPGSPGTLMLWHRWVLAGVANVLALLNHFRTQVGAPDAEYGLEVELTSFPALQPFIYVGLFDDSFATDRYEARDLPVLLPRMLVGSRAEFDGVINSVQTDIYDALGAGHIDRARIELTWP